MANKFAKTAISAGLALCAYQVNAATTVIGCAVPSNNTTGATVYSIDATLSTGASFVSSLSTNVAVGGACSKALNAMVTDTTYGYLVSASNVTIANAGYSLQQFVFSNDATSGTMTPSAGMSLGLVGCSVPPNGTAGATVYSVDALNASGTSLSSSTNSRLGAPCTNGVMTAATAGQGVIYATANIANTKITPFNVTLQNAGYSLQQFLIQ